MASLCDRTRLGSSRRAARLLLAALAWAVSGGATAADANAGAQSGPALTDFEWLRSNKRDRDLHTVNLGAFARVGTFVDGAVELYAGGVLTHSSGTIVQIRGDYAAGTLQRVRLTSDGTGLGPVALVRFVVVKRAGFELGVDARVGALYYEHRFPAGGTHANLAVQAGPVLSYRINAADVVSVGVMRAHLSNGRGIGAHNPSDDGVGLTVQFRYKLL